MTGRSPKSSTTPRVCDFKVVEVIWDDAHVTTGDTTLSEAEKIKPVRTHTIGYLMSNNEGGVVLATDIYPDQPKSGAIINYITHDMIVEWFEYK